MILVVYGTRPEFIKLKPLINEFEKNNIGYKTLFTGQHEDIVSGNPTYRFKMEKLSENRLDSVIKNCLSIPENVFENVKYVLIQGDTSTVLGISIAALHRKIKVIHLEAGLRSFDNNNPYPEEYNRKIVSTIADIHLCPTELNKKNLLNENISEEKIFVVGNTGLDNLKELKSSSSYEDKILITLHRRENHETIDNWFTEVNNLAKKYRNLKFILPIHPNPNVKKYQNILTDVNVIEPLNHDELLNILKTCKLVITDSGGLQEECSFLNKKCLVCRKTTERPESLNTTSFLVEEPSMLSSVFDNHLKTFSQIYGDCPFGNGYSSKIICNILKNI